MLLLFYKIKINFQQFGCYNTAMAQALFTENSYYIVFKDAMKSAKNDKQLFDKIVNLPFHDRKTSAILGLGVVVLLLVNKKERTIDRIALSNTEQAHGAVNYSVKPFKDIKIPLDNRDNYIGIAIRTRRPMMTADWQHMFIPALTAQEARFNQAGAGIACSVIYPLIGARDGGAMIFSFYEPIGRIGQDHHNFMERYSALVTKALNGNN